MHRRLVCDWLGLPWLLLAAFHASLAGQPGSVIGYALQVGPVAMPVSDMDRSVRSTPASLRSGK